MGYSVRRKIEIKSTNTSIKLVGNIALTRGSSVTYTKSLECACVDGESALKW